MIASLATMSPFNGSLNASLRAMNRLSTRLNEFSKSKKWFLVPKDSLTESKSSMNDVEDRFFDTRNASMRSENVSNAVGDAISALPNSLIESRDSLNHSGISSDDVRQPLERAEDSIVVTLDRSIAVAELLDRVRN